MAINLSLGKLPWYGQVGAFAVLAVGAAGVFWNFYAQPAQAQLDVKRAQLATVRADIDRGLATARRLPQFRRDVQTLETQLAQLRAVLPEEQDVAELLRRVQAMATESNLTIRGFAPRPVARKQMHMEWPIGLKLEGRYHDLGAFLARVSKFPRIINVSDVKIRTVEGAPAGATIAAECTATTFVLIESKAPATGAAPARPAATE